MIATTKEQSVELLNLGLNPKTADMYYGYKKDKPELLPYADIEIESLCLPCWSLTALLEMIPPVIPTNGKYKESCNMEFFKGVTGSWLFQYMSGDCTDVIKSTRGTLFESTYKMVVWLLENNYIK